MSAPGFTHGQSSATIKKVGMLQRVKCCTDNQGYVHLLPDTALSLQKKVTLPLFHHL